MTTQTYILCAAAGILGIAFHLFAIKIPSAQTRAKAANIKFTMGYFFSTEIAGVVSSVLAVAICLFIVGELLHYKPEFQNWIITTFAFIGFAGSSVLLAIFGKVSGQINKVIDIKTDVADDKITKDQGQSLLEDQPLVSSTTLPYPNSDKN